MEKKIKHYQSGDKVEYRGEVTTVAFTYLTKGRLNGQIFQFVHLQNGERNVPASKIMLTNKKLSTIFKGNDKLIQHNNVQTKSQIKEDQMDPKNISNKELAALSKEEINNAMGAPFSALKLKKISQKDLIEQYKSLANPKKEKKERVTGYAVRGSLLHMKTELRKKYQTLEDVATSFVAENPDRNVTSVTNHFRTNLVHFRKHGFTIEVKEGKEKSDPKLYKITAEPAE